MITAIQSFRDQMSAVVDMNENWRQIKVENGHHGDVFGFNSI